MSEQFFQHVTMGLGIVVVTAPFLLVFVLGIFSLLKWRISEPTISKITQVLIVAGLVAAVVLLMLMLIQGSHHVSFDLGDWVVIHTPPHDYHFAAKIVFDRLSVPFVILSFLLCGTIGAFASRYMHREPGFNRFFVLYAVFVLGMVIAALAGTIETLFVGWELVGLSSALLVAFFQERPAPARNGLRVWSVYRVSDAALLLAAVALHHMTGEGDFSLLIKQDDWPAGVANLTQNQALVVGLLLLVAAAGKSALIPFCGWLPRAMEGPTPSSAIFYGALSVHLGAFLLLRMSPILEVSLTLSVIVVILGLSTAVFAYLAASVQTDIKSALSFASLLQVGIIVAEIGLGFRYIALIHLLGHACLRTLQFVRAPTLLQDYRSLENAIGARLQQPGVVWERLGASSMRLWLYRLALERGYLDAFLDTYIVTPFFHLFRWCEASERRWVDFLSGHAPRESDEVKPFSGTFEELP